MYIVHEKEDRQRDRWRGRQVDRQTDQQTDRQTDRQIHRRTDRQTNRQTERQTDIHIQTDKQTNRQRDRQTDRQTDSWPEQKETRLGGGQEARPTQRERQQLPALTAGAGGEGHAIAVHLPHCPGVEGPGAPPHIHLEVPVQVHLQHPPHLAQGL